MLSGNTAPTPALPRCDRGGRIARQNQLWSARLPLPSLVATGEGPGMGASSSKAFAQSAIRNYPIRPGIIFPRMTGCSAPVADGMLLGTPHNVA